jgi:hypothetical protein
VLFGAWLISMAVGSAGLWRKGQGFGRTLGLAGLITVLTQFVEGFSLDTFALPQLWLIFGLCTAALWTSPGPALEPSFASEPPPIISTPTTFSDSLASPSPSRDYPTG